MVIKSDDMKNLAWHILYRISLELIYVNILCRIWSYSGFKNEISIGPYIISWILLIAFIPLIGRIRDTSSPSSMMVTVLFYFVFIPGTVMLGRQPSSLRFWILYCTYWALIAVAFFTIKTINIRKPKINICYIATEAFSIFFAVVVVFVWAYYAHLRITFNILDVYGIREEASQYSMPTAISYVLAASRSVIPTLCVYKLARKKYFSFFVLVLVQIINFSIDGLKSALFSLIVAVACYFFYSENIKKYFTKALTGLNVIAIIENVLFSTTIIITVFIRRVIFVPSLFNYYYYDFFTINKPDYFRQTLLNNFGAISEYTKRIPYLIGEFKGNALEYANNGLFSDAYSNLGAIGIFVMPFILMFFLKLFDSCSSRIDNKLVMGAIVANCITLISSNLSVFLVSQGFLITCLVILFLPEDYHYKEAGYGNNR